MTFFVIGMYLARVYGILLEVLLNIVALLFSFAKQQKNTDFHRENERV